MVKALGRVSPTTVAYVCFLLGFVALGTFVYALAAGSILAGLIGAVLVACFALAAVGFRLGAKKLVASNLMESTLDGANIWARPLRQDEIDRYLLAYRGAPVGADEPRRLAESRRIRRRAAPRSGWAGIDLTLTAARR